MTTLVRLAAAACLLPVLALAADHPAVKLGLWEISHQSDSGSQAPVPDDVLSRLPPEARARIEAARASHGPSGRSTKQCVTKASLDHLFNESDHEMVCKRTVVAQTSTSMEMHLECHGKQAGGGPSSTGTLKWKLLDPETMQGTVDMTTTIGPRTMNHKVEIKGKWLGADCGDVKPHDGAGE